MMLCHLNMAGPYEFRRKSLRGTILPALIVTLGMAAWRPTMIPPNLARVSARSASASLVHIAMLDVFKKRHAVRAYEPRPVPDEDVADILAAANSAPSAGGLKAREIRVVTDQGIKQRLARAAHGQEFVAEAAIVLVFWAVPSRSAAKYGERGSNLFALQDATIATSFAWLQAVASGLGACWVGAFDDDAVNDIFRGAIGRDWRPIALLPIGYSAE
jgi:nitroreductase